MAPQKRYVNDPVRLLRETRGLHAANDIRFLLPAGIRALLVQVPLLGGLFASVLRHESSHGCIA